MLSYSCLKNHIPTYYILDLDHYLDLDHLIA